MERTRFSLSATYFYYPGTYNIPKNGPYHHEGNFDRFIVNSKEEILDFLKNDLNCSTIGNGEWTPNGTYYLHHGEYAKPIYRIIRVK